MSDLDGMRANYLVAVDELRRDGWTEDELAEWDASLKAAAESGDAEQLQAAADHLAALAAPVLTRAQEVRAATARLREASKRETTL